VKELKNGFGKFVQRLSDLIRCSVDSVDRYKQEEPTYNYFNVTSIFANSLLKARIAGKKL
jgi:hypothetical protein